MRKNDLFGPIRSLFARRQKKAQSLVLFRDSLENFEISYPTGWRYDQDMAIVEGRYTISFQSPDGQSQFTVAVDAQLAWRFDFAEYAKQELESPTAGIYADAKKGKFRGMDAYRREYSYCSGGKTYFGGGIMFFNGDCVFSLSWSAPEAKREELQPVFEQMVESIRIKEPGIKAPRMKGTRKPRRKRR
ncbi:hypothetical protein H0O00_03955 [Candidatus Micrarchaeota archaeon]|nr:hypothetical protein [Candidatus Micrarchaeota archaeon]